MFCDCASRPVVRSVPSGKINIGCDPYCPFMINSSVCSLVQLSFKERCSILPCTYRIESLISLPESSYNNKRRKWAARDLNSRPSAGLDHDEFLSCRHVSYKTDALSSNPTLLAFPPKS